MPAKSEITLYQAAEDLSELLEQIDPDTGELPPELGAARDIVMAKSQSVAAFILNTEARAAQLTERAKQLTTAAKTTQRRADWLRDYLKAAMRQTGIQEIKGPDFTAKLQIERDQSVEIFEPALLPGDYMREIPAKWEADKNLIKRAIADGFEVPGARIAYKDRLTLK